MWEVRTEIYVGTPYSEMRLSLRQFWTKLILYSDVDIDRVELCPNLTKNVQNTGRIFFTLWSEVGTTFAVPNFTKPTAA
jgi:hypothetical protein